MENLIKNILNILSTELHKKEMKLVECFLNETIIDESFLNKIEILKDNGFEDIIEENIVILTLLGLGRNRIIKILKKDNVDRNMFEQVRDKFNLINEDLRKKNEAQITRFKIETTKRKKRLNELNNVDWNTIKVKYKNGASVNSICKQYNLKASVVTNQLKDDGAFIENRGALNKKAIAEKNYDKIDNIYIENLFRNNPMDGKETLWKKSKKEYPWILRRQFYDKLNELDLTRSAEEINEIKRQKSKVMSNTDYAIKVNSIKAVENVFGSIEDLVDLYKANKIGSYRKIADKINHFVDFDFKISERQVSKIITSHKNYKRKKSSGQLQLTEFVKQAFPNLVIKEEYSYTKTHKKIDIYIPEFNVAIEYNGDYWHSDAVIKFTEGIAAKEFHKQRVQDVAKLGIKLVFVWENDWRKNYLEVEKAIKNKKWESEILNKLESDIYKSIEAPSYAPAIIKGHILSLLRKNNITFERKNNNLIYLIEHDIVINVPNDNLSSKHFETLKLQREYEKNDIELLTFSPWHTPNKIKEFLTYRLNLATVKKIPARKCQFEINEGITREQREFFEKNHLLGYNNFKNIDKTAVLTKDGQIVQAALFVRKNNSSDVELKRLVSLGGLAIQGGPSKLIKNYIKHSKNLERIYTFSDCDLGFGNVYNKLGFELVERSKEQLTWYNEEHDMKFSNLSLIKVGADRLLRNLPNYEPVGIGEGLPSNQEIAEVYGFKKIYDSGYKKWILNVNKYDI